MATARLDITLRNSRTEIQKLRSYHSNASISIAPKLNHFVSELMFLRLFSIFEHSVAEFAYKIASGAAYLNGNSAQLHVTANSVQSARGLFLSHGRPRPRQNLQWTKARHIRESVQFVIPANEPFVRNAQNHGHLIDEMRKIRNAIAHRTSSSRAEFRRVIRQSYGANVSLSPGAFLTSTRRTTMPKLTAYFTAAEVILQNLAGGR